MHGVIRTYRLPEARDLVHALRARSAPEVGRIPGVVAHYVLETGRSLVTVTIHEHEDVDAVAEAAVREAAWIERVTGSPAISDPTVVAGPIVGGHAGAATNNGLEPLASRLDPAYRPGDWG